MKYSLFFMTICMLVACTQRPAYNSVEQESRALCREAADTILAYMPGWKEVYSGYIKSPFHVGEHEYTKTVLSVIVVKGNDTLEISTDEFQWEYKGNSLNEDSAWVGEVGRIYSYEGNVAKIKRHNLLMKDLFKGVPGFSLKVHDNLIKAKYVKFKPNKPKKSLEEYGLTKDDIDDNEVDTVLL